MAPVTWKANLAAVLVAVSIFRKVKGMPGVPDAAVTVIVVVAKEAEEEAWRLPEICNGPATVEEPEEIAPPVKLANPATDKVEEALTGPETFN